MSSLFGGVCGRRSLAQPGISRPRCAISAVISPPAARNPAFCDSCARPYRAPRLISICSAWRRAPRAAVMAGREPAGIGRVDRDGETAPGEKRARRLDDAAAQAAPWQSPSTISAAVLAAAGAGRRRHRVAIDQQIAAERRLGLADQPAQRMVVGVIEHLDAPLRLRRSATCGRRSPRRWPPRGRSCRAPCAPAASGR